MSAYVSIRQHTLAYLCDLLVERHVIEHAVVVVAVDLLDVAPLAAHASIRQHTSVVVAVDLVDLVPLAAPTKAYVSIRQGATDLRAMIRGRDSMPSSGRSMEAMLTRVAIDSSAVGGTPTVCRPHGSSRDSISINRRYTAYVSIRYHTAAAATRSPCTCSLRPHTRAAYGLIH